MVFIRNPIENRFRGAYFISCIYMNFHNFVSSVEQAQDDSADHAKAKVWIVPRWERRGSQSRRKAAPDDYCEGITLPVATAKRGPTATAN